MRLITLILLFNTIVFFACSTFKSIPKQTSNYTIIEDDCSIKPYKSDYFISGYYFNRDYTSTNNSFNICLTDSICFYKIPNLDKYIYVPSDMNIFDLSHDYSFFNDFKNIDKFPDDLEQLITAKINNYKNTNLKSGNNFLFNIKKKNIKYNYNNFKNNSQIPLSYHIVFNKNSLVPSDIKPIYGIGLITDLIEIVAMDSIPFSDFIFIESYPKNFIITEVENYKYYPSNPFWHSALRWDFIKKEKMNCLVIYFKDIESKPKNMTPVLHLKVSGIYKK
jgi:hypothetical protein